MGNVFTQVCCQTKKKYVILRQTKNYQARIEEFKQE